MTTGGVWTYTLDNSNAVVNALNTGGVLTDSFTVLSADGTSQAVDITINGATDIVNHAPTNITLTATDPGAGAPSGVLAAISTTDTDVGDTHVYSIVSASAAVFSISGSNLQTTGLSGNTTYTLEIQTTDSAAATYNETFNIIVGNGAANTLPAGGTGLSTDDVLYGLNQIDLMFGGTGDDTLFGQAGDDQLHGGTGNDTLAGGSGADAFVFDTAPNGSSNVDKILDFVSGTDKIQLAHSVFTALGVGAVGVGAFDIVGVGPVADANTRLIYDQASGALSYDADGTGAGVAIQFATLVANTTLTAADFTII